METQSTPTEIAAVTIHVGTEHHMSALASVREDANTGSVFVGDIGSRIQFAGTPAQLRSLSKAIEDGAMDVERELAEHYASLAPEPDTGHGEDGTLTLLEALEQSVERAKAEREVEEADDVR